MCVYILSMCRKHIRGSNQYLWDIGLHGSFFLIHVLSHTKFFSEHMLFLLLDLKSYFKTGL